MLLCYAYFSSYPVAKYHNFKFTSAPWTHHSNNKKKGCVESVVQWALGCQFFFLLLSKYHQAAPGSHRSLQHMKNELIQ